MNWTMIHLINWSLCYAKTDNKISYAFIHKHCSFFSHYSNTWCLFSDVWIGHVHRAFNRVSMYTHFSIIQITHAAYWYGIVEQCYRSYTNLHKSLNLSFRFRSVIVCVNRSVDELFCLRFNTRFSPYITEAVETNRVFAYTTNYIQ